jgi:hypothetical protein
MLQGSVNLLMIDDANHQVAIVEMDRMDDVKEVSRVVAITSGVVEHYGHRVVIFFVANVESEALDLDWRYDDCVIDAN